MMPLLASLALGTFEFGRALQHHHQLNKSVRDAARYLTRVPATCPAGSPTGYINNAVDETIARNLARTAYEAGGTPIVSYWSDPASITIGVNCLDNEAETLRGVSWMPVIRVSTSVSYSDVGFLGLLGFEPLTLTARHEELHIGE